MMYGRQHIKLLRRCIYAITTLAFGASIILFACQPLETSPGYGKIHPKHLLLIPPEGKLHITWEARHLVVTVKGSVRQGVLSINGSIKQNPEQNQINRLDKVVVDIYLTNTTGKVLRQEVLHATDSPPASTVLHYFQSSYKLPKSTTHIAFGYDLTTGSKRLRHLPIK